MGNDWRKNKMEYLSEKLNNTLLWMQGFLADAPWFYCRKCFIKNKRKSRLTIFSKYCKNCGAKLNWKISNKTKQNERQNCKSAN